jgi:protein-disulfide isomerase
VRKSRALLLAVMLLPLVGAPAMLAAEEAEGPAGSIDSEAVFGERVRSYLLSHPEVLLEAAKLLERRQQVAKSEAARQAISVEADRIFRDPASPVVGNPGGDVTLVEFFDYNCHYCKKAAPDVARLVEADPGLRVVYKEFPILGPGSVVAARAALAAMRQGKYQPFHDALMASTTKLSETEIFAKAEEVGIDLPQLRQDMADPAIEQQIQGNLELARTLSINMTPAFVIGDNMVPGVIGPERLAQLVAEVRESRKAVN